MGRSDNVVGGNFAKWTAGSLMRHCVLNASVLFSFLSLG